MKRRWASNQFVVVILVAIMIAIIVANTVTFFSMSTRQTEEIGTARIVGIRDDLQMVLMDAKSRINSLAYETNVLLDSGADQNTLRKFIGSKKEEIIKDNENIISVYALGEDWSIIPGYSGEDKYDRSTRMWYQELVASGNNYAISSSYQDMFTDNMCFTIAEYLEDGITLVGLDYYLNNIQQSVTKMCADGNGDALIVDPNGTIVGYTDEEKIGNNISEVLPEYETALHLARRISDKCESFELDINGENQTVFCTKTDNNWYLIYSIDSYKLYGNTYSQLIRNTLLYIVFGASIIVLYIYSDKNRKRAEETLLEKEMFLDAISNEFREPLRHIIQSSDFDVFNQAENKKEILDLIKESSLKLSSMTENLFSYSNLLQKSKEVQKEKNIDSVQNYFRRGLIVTVAVAMVFGIVFSVDSTLNLATDNLESEVQSYSNVIGTWMTKQESILEMFANVIAANPDILNDYDETISFLDDITQNYDEISVTYMTNPEWDNQGVMMNNGWEPEDSYILSERQWYKDTVESEDGFNISDPYYDAQTGLYCITFSKTVYSKTGEFIGVFAIDFYLDKLVSILGDTYGNAGYAFLVDGSGTIINHPHDLYELTQYNSFNIADSEYNEVVNNDGIAYIKDYDGNYKVCMANHEAVSDFSVITVKNFMYIYKGGIIRLVILSVVFIFCIMLIAWIMRSLTAWQARNQEQLEEAAKSAVQATESQAQFFAQMSHEIRTPINAILGMNEMILRESDGNDIEEYAYNINSAGQTLLHIINNLLDFSKLQNGKLDLISVSYDTGIWIDGLVNMVEESAGKKGLDFNLVVDEKIPKKLYGDDMKLSQVVINLLSNAVKYTNSGSVALRILCNKINLDNQTVNLRVEVEDTGIGIKEEDRESLFTAFTRLDEMKNHGIEGTGLGVTIVKEFLNMMDSKLEVESEYGKGSKFSFEVVQTIADAREIGKYVPNKSIKHISGKNNEYVFAPDARILVVDDNDANLNVAKSLLKRSKAQVTVASSGTMAMDILKDKQFDLIFMDHMMPQMDGIETLHRIKDEKLIEDGVPVIALTANAIAGAKEMYLHEGFDNYLSKPIQPSELEQVLGRYLPDELISKKKDDREKIKKETFILIKEVNVNKGLNFMQNDEELYLNTLIGYYKGGEERKAGLKEALANKDWHMYKIHAHTLKSNSYNIGADEVGDISKLLEQAANDENQSLIEEEHDILIQKFEELLENIRVALEARGVVLSSNVQGIDEQLIEALEEFNQEEAMTILNDIPKDKLNLDMYEAIVAMIQEFNFMEATEVAKSDLFK